MIVTASDEGIWTTDDRMITTFANERVATLLGYTVEEMVGRPADDFVHASARDLDPAGVRAATARDPRAPGGPAAEERRHRSSGRASRRALSWTVDGRFLGSLVMGTDITELRLSEERFRTIFRACPAAIGIGSGGTILDANDRYCEFYGYDRSELIGRTVQELKLWVDPADRVRMLEGVKAKGALHNFATRFRRKDGTIRDALMAVETVELTETGGSAGDGEPTILIMVEDVTERNASAARLREGEERYRVLFDASPMPMWAYDPESLHDRHGEPGGRRAVRLLDGRARGAHASGHPSLPRGRGGNPRA